jgi:hypothetical protein
MMIGGSLSTASALAIAARLTRLCLASFNLSHSRSVRANLI